MKRFILLSNLALVGVLAALHLLGARAYVGFLSGTVPGGAIELCIGLVYALAWFAVVLWVPISTLALILDATCDRLLRWRRSQGR